MMLNTIKYYIKESKRILKIAKRPTLEETIKTFKVSLYLMFAIGFVGLVVHIVFSFLY